MPRSCSASSAKATALPPCIEMMLPDVRSGIEPLKYSYWWKRWCITISPAVARSILLRNPIRPRLGMWKSRCVRPSRTSMRTISPLREAAYSMTVPASSAGTSTVSTSTGSLLRPPISL